MTPDDQKRFRELIIGFAAGFPFPFHLVCIDAVGQIVVTHHGGGKVEEVCRHATGPALISPMVVTIIGPSGVGRSATLTIENTPPALQ